MSLSYLHRYHAGNFADIHKHICLIALLESMQQKETPFTVFDIFAGEGQYLLSSAESRLNKEHANGIDVLIKAYTENYPDFSKSLVRFASLDFYPGSPYIISRYLRENDRAHFIEKHPKSFHYLKQNFTNANNCHIHLRDAYEGANALLPPKTNRGLIFIDPSYEIKKEYSAIVELVTKILKKFSHGHYLIWYPILKNERYHERFTNEFEKLNLKKILKSEWYPDFAKKSKGLIGSGVLIINPSWKLDDKISAEFDYLNINVYRSGKQFTKWLNHY